MSHILAILLVSLVDWLVPDTVRLVFVGDAMQHGPQLRSAARAGGKYDYSPCFKFIEPVVESADYAIVNLECPLGGEPYSGYPAFSAPDEYASALKSAGFDFFTTANNHCMDRGSKGVIRTIDALDRLGVPHVGTYKTESARDSLAVQVVTFNRLRVAILSYTYGTNGIPVSGGVSVGLIDRKRMAAEIELARKLCDMVCVCMHWGEEYQLLPSKGQRDLADFLVDQGVDLIIGSHPHVIQPMERRFSAKWGKEVLVVYSLGNFISNQNGEDSRGGAMVEVELIHNYLRPWAPQIGNAGYRLFFCQKPGTGAVPQEPGVGPLKEKSGKGTRSQAKVQNDAYQLIPAAAAGEYPWQLRPASREAYRIFVTRAREVFKANNKRVEELCW